MGPFPQTTHGGRAQASRGIPARKRDAGALPSWLIALFALTVIGSLVAMGWAGKLPIGPLDLHVHEGEHEEPVQHAHGEEREGAHEAHSQAGSSISSPLIQLEAESVQTVRETGPSSAQEKPSGQLWHVTPAGPLSLSEVVLQARPGDHIYVAAGNYRERLNINKPVHLIAEPGAVLHGGEDRGDVLLIEADGVHVSGLQVEAPEAQARGDGAAIKVRGHGNHLENLIVVSAGHGIYIERGGENSVVNSRLSGWPGKLQDDLGNGIHLFDTTDNRLLANRIEAVRDGVYLSFAMENTLQDNEITRSRYAIHEMYSRGNEIVGNRLWNNVGGGALMFSRQSHLAGNLFADHASHRGYGLLLKDSNNNVLEANRFVGNRTGIFMDMSAQNHIRRNDIHDNGIGVDVLSSSEGNLIYSNNFSVNQSDVRLNRGRHQNSWDDGEGVGNFWLAYRGVDLSGDGRGDLPHSAGSAYGQWAGDHPLLWALAHSPAAGMLDWLERLMPTSQVPKARDDFPLLRPVQTMSPTADARLDVSSGGERK